MNKKNEGKRMSASLNLIAHKRLKDFATRKGYKLNHALDEAVFMYLKVQANPLSWVQLREGQ